MSDACPHNAAVNCKCVMCGAQMSTHLGSGVVYGMGRAQLRFSPPARLDWTHLWRAILRGLDYLRDLYGGENLVGGPDLQRQEDGVWQFFVDCWSLRDWLRNSGADAPGTRAVQTTHPDTLFLAQAIANTHKHLDTWDWLPDVELQAIIHYGFEFKMTSTAGQPRFVDALDLAQRCVADWRKWLSDHSLQESVIAVWTGLT